MDKDVKSRKGKRHIYICPLSVPAEPCIYAQLGRIDMTLFYSFYCSLLHVTFQTALCTAPEQWTLARHSRHWERTPEKEKLDTSLQLDYYECSMCHRGLFKLKGTNPQLQWYFAEFQHIFPNARCHYGLSDFIKLCHMFDFYFETFYHTISTVWILTWVTLIECFLELWLYRNLTIRSWNGSMI